MTRKESEEILITKKMLAELVEIHGNTNRWNQSHRVTESQRFIRVKCFLLQDLKRQPPVQGRSLSDLSMRAPLPVAAQDQEHHVNLPNIPVKQLG